MVLSRYSPAALPAAAGILLLILHISPPLSCRAIRSFPENGASSAARFGFSEAPEYRNGAGCLAAGGGATAAPCDPSLVHVAMTLDSEYLRGSVAAVHSVLRHASCPEQVFFHFVAAEFDPSTPRVLTRVIRSVFPSLNFKVYIFREETRRNRMYELGSLPPFLLVFGGDVEPIGHRWNQHGLGGDNVAGSCRALHPGPVSLLHWSGKGKPWVRLDEGRPCPLDHLWEPYDMWKGQDRHLRFSGGLVEY
ncbi:Probable galacturonosyltransferase-like 10 [Striga hermonthica]|uniref:Hexosyltransferase n=1 Tax=Striga hermonthica TaxID=68872 RepID=A0A9N7RK85_STRHE|nr:Probable galacturonosyltransferase-like 10 [Striga hermonthica]